MICNIPGVRAGSLNCSGTWRAGGVSVEDALSPLASHDAVGDDFLGYFLCIDES